MSYPVALIVLLTLLAVALYLCLRAPSDPTCTSCVMRVRRHVCVDATRRCGHHCNHFEDTYCHYCGAEFSHRDL